MNRLFKRITAFSLAMLLALSMLTAVAFAQEAQYTQSCPLINIPGFMSTELFKDKDSGNDKIWPPSPQSIITGVSKLLPSIAKFSVDKNYDAFGDNTEDALMEVFGELFIGSNGELLNNSGIHFTYPDKSTIKKDSTVDFQYDWRLDPMDTAQELNKFIDYVLECSGCDKVSLSAHSCGGVIVVSYVSMYGTEKLHGVIMNSTAVYGETFTGELLTGKFKLTAESVLSYLKTIYSKSQYDYTIGRIMKMINDAGLMNFIDSISDDIVEHLYDRLAKEMILPFFAYWLNIWAMVPDEYFDEAYSYIFDTMLADNGVDYSVLKEKIQSYNSVVRVTKTEKLQEMEANCRFGVFSRYGFSAMPLSPSWDNSSDCVIDVKNTSFGATTSKFNQALTDEQIAASSPEMISPDKTIDASTCMFPEKTWFIKNYFHFTANILLDLQYNILYNDEVITVDSFEEYPRFLTYSSEERAIIADQNEEQSFLNEVKGTFKSIINLIKLLITKLTAQGISL